MTDRDAWQLFQEMNDFEDDNDDTSVQDESIFAVVMWRHAIFVYPETGERLHEDELPDVPLNLASMRKSGAPRKKKGGRKTKRGASMKSIAKSPSVS